MQKREHWGTRTGFILAAAGSAIGLGNIWRFPYMTYDNGGGLFLLVYLFALLTAGIPLLILEFGLGHKYRGAPPSVFARISNDHKQPNRWEWLGWYQTALAAIISFYYVVVIAWTLVYFGLSFYSGWGSDPANFFYSKFLGLPAGSQFNFLQINWTIMLVTGLVWFFCWIILYGGIQKGIELAGKIFMPMLIAIIVIITIRVLFLEGAAKGLDFLFKPNLTPILTETVLASGIKLSRIDISKLIKVLIAAYGQVFFSLSVGFAVMISYSSYLPKRSDTVNNAFITGLLDSGFSILAGTMIFAILGSMSVAANVEVSQVVNQGIGLAFITIPKALEYLPATHILGPLFFISLTIAGITSAISIMETIITGLKDKFEVKREKSATFVCCIGFLFSLIFATRSGIIALDIVDHFINNFGILISGLLEVILLSWIFKSSFIKNHVNKYSDFSIGSWWIFSIKILMPILLGSMVVSNMAREIQHRYENYPLFLLIIFGWVVMATIFILSFAVASTKGCKDHYTGHLNNKEE